MNVWYITCFPSNKELNRFPKETEYIWINTNYQKCIENIYNRDGKKSNSVREQLVLFNEKILKKYIASDINFTILDVFDSEERW